MAAFSHESPASNSVIDVHEQLKFHGTIFTDSGGYQVSTESSFDTRVTDEGIEFVAHWNGASMLLTPQKSMKIQQSMGSDVAMVLDDMVGSGSDYERHVEATERSCRWAELCLRHHSDSEQLLFGICQGGPYEELRGHSAAHIESLGFPGVALGGIAINQNRDERLQLVSVALGNIASFRPRYAMGIGHPVDILDMVAIGIDCFDAAFPTIQAQKGVCLTSSGMLSLGDLSSALPFEADCDCSACSGALGRADRRHTHTDKNSIVELLAEHNLRFMTRFMREVRCSINAQDFDRFRRNFTTAWTRPKAKRGLTPLS
jgi:queuine tRNA-ribosyltransferase